MPTGVNSSPSESANSLKKLDVPANPLALVQIDKGGEAGIQVDGERTGLDGHPPGPL